MEHRQLAAIMFTDIVGYSALMSKDEKLALQVLSKNREIHKVAISKHNGEFIKEIGDGTLSIFRSSVDAVSCALEIQKACCTEQDFRVRIGIHVGDIIFRDNDVFGDGVNIASRIESSGEPGRIYFSEKVYDDIRNKTDLKAEFIGEKQLKNIDYPVKVYALRESDQSSFSRHGTGSKKPAWFNKHKYPIITAISVFVILIILYTLYLINHRASLNLNKDLIATAIFENQTGEESLNPLGRMASDWITQGIAETGLLSVVPSVAILSTDHIHQNMDAIQALAKETRAQTIITGVYYKQGENLQFYAHIVDAGKVEVLNALGPINGPVSNPLQPIETIRQKVLGALAAHFDPHFNDYSDRKLTPPSYDSYKEFLSGLELFFKYQFDDAIVHFGQAYHLDTNHLLPLLWMCHSYYGVKGYHIKDSLIHVLNARRGKMTTGEQYFLDFIVASHQGDLEGTYKASHAGARYHPILNYEQCYDALQANHPQASVDILLTLKPDKLHFPGWYWEILAMAYHMLGEYNQELKTAMEERHAHPELFASLWNELKALAALGRMEEINNLFAESLSMPKSDDWTPGTPGWLMFITSQELRAHGYMEEATNTIERSIQWYVSHPDDEHAFHLAQAYYVAEQWDQSNKIIGLLSANDPDNMHYLAYTGLIAARLGDSEKAEEVSTRLENMEQLPVGGRNTCYRARIAALLGGKGKAVQLLQTAFSQGFHNWEFDIYLPELMDFESIRDYPPFVELFKPKE
jgi:class 3 adenylate cyclase/tetratricopeptide (TPR) repeat protein